MGTGIVPPPPTPLPGCHTPLPRPCKAIYPGPAHSSNNWALRSWKRHKCHWFIVFITCWGKSKLEKYRFFGYHCKFSLHSQIVRAQLISLPRIHNCQFFTFQFKGTVKWPGRRGETSGINRQALRFLHFRRIFFLKGPRPLNSKKCSLIQSGYMESCLASHSVADPGCFSRIPDPDFYPSRIPDLGSRI